MHVDFPYLLRNISGNIRFVACSDKAHFVQFIQNFYEKRSEEDHFQTLGKYFVGAGGNIAV